jgi:hypothetical protein
VDDYRHGRGGLAIDLTIGAGVTAAFMAGAVIGFVVKTPTQRFHNRTSHTIRWTSPGSGWLSVLKLKSSQSGSAFLRGDGGQQVGDQSEQGP